MITQYTYFHFERMDKQIKKNNGQIKILALLFLISIIIPFFRIPEMVKQGYFDSKPVLKQQVVAKDSIATPTPQILTIKRVVAEKTREVTAYNVGDANQTDESPCIGASGVDICNLLDHGVCVYAANFVKIGTYLSIDGVECQVLDRLNSKYPNRVDIAMKLSEKEQAIEYGLKSKNVRVLK